MKLLMHLAQPISHHVRINLGRADAGMSEQLLNHPQVRVVVQQMRGKTWPQHMGRDIARNACKTRALFDAKPEGDAGERSSTSGEKYIGRRTSGHESGTAALQIPLQSGYGFAAQR